MHVMVGKFIAYYRACAERERRSGFDIYTQRQAVADFIASKSGTLLGEFTETESGKTRARPQLQEAIRECKRIEATLVIARIDRLSRNTDFLFALRDSSVLFVAADMPDANTLTVGILALLAEHEREAASRRTKEALAEAKRRGVKLGNPQGARALQRAGKGNDAAITAIRERANLHADELLPVIQEIRANGASTLQQIADALNASGVSAPRGGTWHPSSVRNLMARMDARGHSPALALR